MARSHHPAPRFTDAWKARLRHPAVPREAIPPALKLKFDEANKDNPRFRRASSSLGSKSSLSITEWDDERKTTSAKVAPA